MGQKVHPTGFRLGVIKKHNALWYAKGKSYRENLIEDLKVRDLINKKDNSGTITFNYKELDQLDRLIKVIKNNYLLGNIYQD